MHDFTCPNGHVVVRDSRFAEYLGDPVRVCPECGLTVHLSIYREWVDFSPKDRRLHVIGIAMGMLFPGVFLGVFIGAVAMLVALLFDAPESVLLPLLWGGTAVGPLIILATGVRAVRASLARKPLATSPPPPWEPAEPDEPPATAPDECPADCPGDPDACPLEAPGDRCG